VTFDFSLALPPGIETPGSHPSSLSVLGKMLQRVTGELPEERRGHHLVSPWQRPRSCLLHLFILPSACVLPPSFSLCMQPLFSDSRSAQLNSCSRSLSLCSPRRPRWLRLVGFFFFSYSFNCFWHAFHLHPECILLWASALFGRASSSWAGAMHTRKRCASPSRHSLPL
jgi:hypothetical protein